MKLLPKLSFASTLLVLSGCSTFDNMSLLDHVPFMGDSTPSDVGQPKDATKYVCKSGKSFYVRMLNKENAAWVIFPDREARFDKTGDRAGFQFGNGTAVLSINGSQADIKDGEDASLTDCKVPSNSTK